MQQAKPTASVRDAKPRRRAAPAPRASARASAGASTRPGPKPARTSVRLAPGVILFERYRLEHELGRGGVADVWRAHDERLDRAVAIKVLHPDLLPDEGWRRRFVSEARGASSLAHPGIVPVYDVLDDPETPAIVFQLVDGESLATRLAREGSIPLEEATRIAGQVAGALDHAHRAGLIHRDVKPANIVIDRDGRARLVDFGIARLVDDASAEREGRQVVGTLRYMAPEQLGGKPADARSDLYALGLVIAEMVPDLEAAPDWLRELVVRLREPDPDARPSSAADVARALETGRLDLDLETDGNRIAPDDRDPGLGSAIAAVDPDAVTRSFRLGDPIEAEAPRRETPAPPSDPEAQRLEAEVPLAAAAAATLPARAESSPRQAGHRLAARTDNRPIVVAVLVAGLLLAGFALGRGNLFGAASATPTPVVAPAVVGTPAPTDLPAAQPPAKPHKGHGHGRG